MLTKLLREDTLRTLDAKKRSLSSNPEFANGLSEYLIESLGTEALIHSNEMELTRHDANAKFNIESKLKRAAEYASDVIGEKLSTREIMQVASMIETDNLRYRQQLARPNGIDLVYPNSAKVPELMDSLVSDVNNSRTHPVEKALYTHFQLCRIHPFHDGNGRLARLLQNVMLQKAGFPPTIILAGEKSAYLDLMTAAQTSYQERQPYAPITQQEALFYSFLASKLNVSFDKLSELLASQKRYEIELEAREKGTKFTATRMIKSYLSRRHLPASARLVGNSLHLTGKFDMKVILGILDGVHGLDRFELKQDK